jgi:catechol 2,3-dioxygenase-like lactoylglutathione lyase family enzyme
MIEGVHHVAISIAHYTAAVEFYSSAANFVAVDDASGATNVYWRG